MISDLTTGATTPEDVLLPVTPATARSQTFDLGVTVGLGETDNVAETESDRRSQTMAVTGVDFGWIRTGSALDANVVGDFNYLDYLQNAYGGQLLGRFDGLTTLSLFSDHLRWLLQDDFGEGLVDPYTPSTPNNLERINVVRTGPEVILRPTSNTVVQFGVHYADATYEVSPLDGRRTSEDVLLEQLLSTNSSVALGAETEQLRFSDTDASPDYDRDRYYARYEITGARTHITAIVGETQVNDGGEWFATPLLQLVLSHELSQQSTVYVTAGRQLTDAADSFSALRSGAAGGIAVAPVAETTGDYLDNYVTATGQVTGERTTVAVTGAWERDTYTNPTNDVFDVTRGSLQLSLDRQLSGNLKARIFGTFMESRYFNQDGEIDSRLIGANVTWQASRALSLEGRYSHDFQGTSGAGYGFSANTLFVTVTYRPLPQNLSTPAAAPGTLQ